MKACKLLLWSIPIAALTLCLWGCVDKDYDLSKVSDGSIVIGSRFEIPLGKITYRLDDIFDNINSYVAGNGYDPANIGSEPMKLDISNQMTFAIDEPIGSNVADFMGDDGELKLDIEGVNTIPLDYSFQLSFVIDPSYMYEYGYTGEPGEEYILELTPIAISAGTPDSPTSFSGIIGVTADEFNQICYSHEIRFSMVSGEEVVVFNKTDAFKATIKLIKIGGIHVNID